MFIQIFKIVWKNKGQNSLLLLEIFVSFIILAGVFTYLFTNYTRLKEPLGFETKNRWMVLFFDIYTETDPEEYVGAINNLKMTLDNMPEIKSHSFGGNIYPFSWNNSSSNVEINNVQLDFYMGYYDENYQKTLDIPMAAGRWLEKPLADSDLNEVVVNKIFVEMYFPDQSIVDSVFEIGGQRKVVGVVENYKYDGEFALEYPMVIMYQDPYMKEYASTLYLHIADNVPGIFEEQLSKIITETTGRTDFIIKNLEEDRIDESRNSWVNIMALSVFALFLVINVAMGLFGVLWYNINKRRYEISLSKAMGATEGHILLQFVVEILGLTMIALLIGSLVVGQVAYFNLIAYFEQAMLYKGWIASLIFVLVLVTICALYPAWRAAKMHPAEGLKEE